MPVLNQTLMGPSIDDAPVGAQLDQQIKALLDKIGQPQAPTYTPEEVQQRRARNDTEYQLGLLGMLSGDEALGGAGGAVFKQALANRQPKITEKGSMDPITGEFRYGPDYLAQLDQTKLDALQKQKLAYETKLEAEKREREFRQQMAGQQFENAKVLKSMGGAGREGADDARRWRGEDSLAGDFDRFTKDSREEMQAIGKLQATLGGYQGRKFDPIAQQSVAILLQKFLDPGSVVREAEFSRAAEAAGLADRVMLLAKRIDSGDFLTPDVLQQIGYLGQIYQQAAEESMRRNARNYIETAQRRGYDPRNVVRDPRWHSPAKPATPSPQPAPGAPQPAPGGANASGAGGGWSIKPKGP